MPKFKAVLFDKDGVLIDSLETCMDAFNDTLVHFQKPTLSREGFIREVWGVRAETVINSIFFDKNEHEREEIRRFYNNSRAMRVNKTQLFSSTVPTLQVLKASGVKTAVVTNTLKRTALKLLNDFGILQYFDEVIGGDEAEAKPSPAPVLLACERLGVRPEEALYVGDTPTDAKAGKAAGCITAIITTSHNAVDLAEIGDILIIDDLSELLNIVQ
ncbi:MAG: HAD-IA family hydrolase [Candidatus Aenigmarchaeota archaeon]|nr:HAD-IA family hydrolase [Candidatus Aenigmarchaeota archaeon]